MKNIQNGFLAIFPNGAPCVRTFSGTRHLTEALLVTTIKEEPAKMYREGFKIVAATRTFEVADVEECGIDPVEDRKQDGLAEARELQEEMMKGQKP